jgi:hypothetical protein
MTGPVDFSALVMAQAVVGAELQRHADANRADVALEVIDTARFERAGLSWLARVEAGATIHVEVDHAQVQRSTLCVTHACPAVLTGSWGSRLEWSVAINPSSVVMVQELNSTHTSSHSKHGCLASWLVSAWDGGFVLTVFMRNGRALKGAIAGVNTDAVDLLIDGTCVTLNWSCIVLARHENEITKF